VPACFGAGLMGAAKLNCSDVFRRPRTPARRIARRLLVLASAASALTGASRALGTSTTWANVDVDWLTPANWMAGPPDASIDAVFPASFVPVSPDVSSDASASGISIDNTGGEYWITGAGTVNLGANGLSVSGGGTTNIAPTLALAATAALSVG